MIRIIIADDHHLVRQGIRALLEKSRDLIVIAEAEDGRQAMSLVEQHSPEVLIMDIAMPKMSGLQAVEKIRELNLPTRVVILSMYSSEILVRQSLSKGASGYLLKQSIKNDLLDAIRTVMQGRTYLCPALVEVNDDDRLARQQEGDKIRIIDNLTLREREVLQLVVEGNTNSGIANQLSIRVKTVEKHRSKLMKKLRVYDVAGLVKIAIKEGLIFIEDTPG